MRLEGDVGGALRWSRSSVSPQDGGGVHAECAADGSGAAGDGDQEREGEDYRQQDWVEGVGRVDA